MVYVVVLTPEVLAMPSATGSATARWQLQAWLSSCRPVRASPRMSGNDQHPAQAMPVAQVVLNVVPPVSTPR